MRALSTASTAAIIALAVGVWQAVTSLGLVSPLTLPGPESVWVALRELLAGGELGSTTITTLQTVLISFAIGSAAGIVAGIAFWLLPLAGKTFEPYLVAFYAVPLVIFHPILLVVVGLDRASLVILASAMTFVPVCLNTWLGFERVPRVYLRLADALECGPRRRLFSVLLPAAAEQILAGIRIGLIYAIVGTLAMEFLVAPSGLGFQVRYEYQAFHQPATIAYTVVIFVLALALVTVMRTAESVVRR